MTPGDVLLFLLNLSGIVFPSEEDRARFVFLTDRIFSGVHYESYIFQAVSKLILCRHISKLAKFFLGRR